MTERLLLARPGLHYAAVPGGVYVSGGSGEFCLRGSDLLFDAVDVLHPLLVRGAGEDELVAGLGGESARGVVRALVGQLDTHGLLIHPELLSVPAPSDAVRARHAEALAHLEAVAPDPYAVFARLQATTVEIRGGDLADAAAVDGVRRTLERAGVGRVVTAPDDAPVQLRIDLAHDRSDRDPDPTTSPNASTNASTEIVVAVRTSEDVCLVAVGTDDDGDRWRRVRAWASRLDRGGLPQPVAHRLAAAYAAQLAVEQLVSAPGSEEVGAVVISGADATAEQTTLPTRAPAGTHLLAPGVASPSPAAQEEHRAALLETLAAPWVGDYDATGGDHLPQLPTAQRHGVPVAHVGPARVVAGADQAEVALALGLALRRDAGGPGGAAGTSRERWLLDGALRHLASASSAPSAPHRHEQRTTTRADAVTGPVRAPEVIRLRRAAERLGQVRLETTDEHAVGWVLARVRVGELPPCAAWGPDVATASADALALAVVAAEAPVSTVVDRLRTDALARASEADVAALVTDVTSALARGDLAVVGVRAGDDPVHGTAALWSGPVRVTTRGADR